MRGLGGFVLLAGIGVGLFVYFPAPVDRDTSLEQAQRAVATRVASSTPDQAGNRAGKRAHTIARGKLCARRPACRSTTQIACRRGTGGSRRARPRRRRKGRADADDVADECVAGR